MVPAATAAAAVMGLTQRLRASTVAGAATAVRVALRGVLPLPATAVRVVLAATAPMVLRVVMAPSQARLASMAVLAAKVAPVVRVVPAV
jgi:hypothetical protein